MANSSVKTSITDPLQIQCVTPPGMTGVIGMTLCPGRKGLAVSGMWDRDLGTDLEAVRAWKPDLVLALLEEHEYKKNGVPDFRKRVGAAGLPWTFAAIPDGHAPNHQFLASWQTLGPRIRNILRLGGRVLIHCRAGLERTGTIAALLLIELGMTAQAAIDAVRGARGKHAIAQQTQEPFVRAWQPLPERRSRSSAIAGSLYGGAIGDALGAPFEELTADRIEAHLGQPFVWQFHASYPGSLLFKHPLEPGSTTDDTAMALSVASVVSAGGDLNARRFATAFLSDLDPSRGRFGKMFWQGAPGIATSKALKRLDAGADPATCGEVQDGGNGAAMRAHPVGFLTDRQEVLRVAAVQAKVTHGHPAAIAAAQAVAVLVHDALLGCEPTLDPPEGIGEPTFIAAWNKAHHWIERGSKRLPPHLLSAAKSGWATVAAACAIAFVYQDDPKRAIAAAAASGVDTDTVASIVGAIIGARCGIEALSEHLVTELKARAELLEVFNTLSALPRNTDKATPAVLKILKKPTKLAEFERQVLRVYRMLAELHKRGYQQLRIIPIMVGEGDYPANVTFARNVFCDNGALPVDLGLIATCGNDEGRLFRWQDASKASAAKLADRFIQRFPVIAQLGYAPDPAYVSWFEKALWSLNNGEAPMALDAQNHTDIEAPARITTTKGSESSDLLMPPRGLHEKNFFGQATCAIVSYPEYELLGGHLGVARQRFNHAILEREKQYYLRMSAVYEWAHFLEIPLGARVIADAASRSADELDGLINALQRLSVQVS